MTVTRSLAAVTLALVLAAPGLAAAECAWVLWAYSLEKSTGELYSLELARATRQECLTEVREMGATLKGQGYTVTGGGLVALRSLPGKEPRASNTSASPTPSTRVGRREAGGEYQPASD